MPGREQEEYAYVFDSYSITAVSGELSQQHASALLDVIQTVGNVYKLPTTANDVT
jgi:hypothetical protein